MTSPDLAMLVARLGAALHAEGVPVTPEQCQRFTRAIQLTGAATTGQVYRCAEATLLCDVRDLPALRRVCQLVFGGMADPSSGRGQAAGQGGAAPPTPGARPHRAAADTALPAGGGHWQPDRGDPPGREDRTSPQGGLAAATERLATRDFSELSAAELAELVAGMRRLRLLLPRRRSRRTSAGRRGPVIDLRATLRRASRGPGDPVRLLRRRVRQRPRRLVVLCDISGSMAPYARALLQLLYSAAHAGQVEVFTFATRLTRLTRTLVRGDPHQALRRAGQAAPDWSGGTRIGASLREFNRRYGAAGMARGAVVLVLSDGWETGPAEQLGEQMAWLSRLAHRVVWANPRTASDRYRPLVAGMAAAWPHCDAVVSGHSLAALDDLLAVLAGAPAGGGRRHA